ncbi:DNA translocase FtsK 4TM domain-containing protein [Candidatus Nanosynbacter sp. TM7-087]|uniref:FtsK/SpoIIIE family DNA translocase n=1 Tax=Candidatus Nanosynbacter sp. TM7-087 TaxID=2902631 RepID=UPI001FB709F8|nr:DNA translocase FtsK 4TM domain-containing protein [Candidatus Nanosynbacter sp. TM7-087]MCJ1966000.1 DNA translocase FtsK 4TM domain-containing protein [Candidatus Nanosynbacter sp. TM7-087]
MAKKRKSTKKSAPTKPQHSLPVGFWSQVGAVMLILLSLLLVVSWFGVGGPVLQWIDMATVKTIGYTAYALPILLIYLAVETFRAEENQLPAVVKFAAILEIVWFSGLFGLMKTASHPNSGGFVGDILNTATLKMVDSAIAVIIYLVLAFITVLFITQTSPFTVFSKLWEMIKSNTKEDDDNRSVMKKASIAQPAEEEKKTDLGEIKLNAGVPIIDTAKEKKSLLKKVEKPEKVNEEQALVAARDPNWEAPSLDLLEKNESGADAGDTRQNAQIIHDTLAEFNIEAAMGDINVGPKVTQYTLRPPSGVKLTRITALETNIALNLAAQSLRIEAPIPGQRAVGIEVPNRKAAEVRLRSTLSSKQWAAARDPLSFGIGKDISGQVVVGELGKMPHLLIAGQTGSGKSVMINTLLCSLLYRNSPSDMKLILVDPKQVEMAPYADIPHLLTPVINEPEKTISALKWAVNEMERRYKLLAGEKIRNIKEYNKRLQSRAKKIAIADENGNVQEHEDGSMPYIVIVVDEMSDLMMMAKKDVETLIVRLAQKSRAVGIHLVLATQRPSVNVITGLIKANVPARIAFTVASQVDSITILDQSGAEKLLGQGDMLFYVTSMSKPKRIQGAWVTDDEVNKIADHLRMQMAPQYNDEVVAQPVQLDGKGGVVMDLSEGGDDKFKDAVRVVVERRKASTSMLQTRLGIGYQRAARIIEEMEERGIIGPQNGSKPREVLISSPEELDELLAE